ncbi:MAG: DUF6691 family protein, partial [Kiritimatiellia bacterium]
EFRLKDATLVPIAAGGLLFGIGWAIAGFCPGTAVGAVGEGSLHAVWAVLGMLVGAGVYAEVYPYLPSEYMKMCDLGKVMLPELAGISYWTALGIMAFVFLVFLVYIERK